MDFLALAERLATNPDVNVEKLSAILAIQERVMTRQAETDFNTAFHEMEPLLPRIKKNGQVEYKNKAGVMEKAFRFSKWDDVDNSIRPILRAHGFSLSFETALRVGDGGGLTVTGTLLHVGGHSKSSSIPLALDSSGGKNNIQAAGSTFSYGCRYTTRMLLNLISEGDDDDGARGGAEYITAEQIGELTALIAATNTDKTQFLTYFFGDAVNDLNEVDARDFAKLKNGLLRKKADQAKPPGQRQ